MELPVINIGNSKGIRIPKSILKQYNIKSTLEIVLEKERIILKPKPQPRQGWENAFKEMSKNKADELLIEDVFEDENFDEWI